MSLFPAVMDLLRAEAAFKPITGDLVLIGRQRVEHSEQTDKEFFATLGDASFHALDVSDFEGADIIHDLNAPLPRHLYGIADFIFDGSCLDNIFNTAAAMRTLSRLLKPGGRIVLMEHGTAFQGPGAPAGALMTFSPEWFFDFFAAFDYADCQIYLAVFPWGMFRGDWSVRQWEPFDAHDNPVSPTPMCGDFVNIVIAEKGLGTPVEIMPIQAQYRLMHGSENNRYVEAHRRYKTSERHKHHAAILRDLK